ncbi:thioesterase II family protein [Streptomyces buecherae]|uniref:thioesterase II family protein n=2 Tax=Streptomyces buecherae TaxID=2763006 RepID=UPI00164E5655|nr:thioesterase [Streptomyces buecherae]QNJ43814.1 thioesterase [Streptomyces buecherae]
MPPAARTATGVPAAPPSTTTRSRPRPTHHGSVTCPRPVPDPALRLFLFHHAGGSHLLYRGWAEHFPADWEVCLVNAPGRGSLHDVGPLASSEELVAYLVRDLEPLLDRPYAFFGHSMGGLVGYELSRRLATEGRQVPRWLGVSSWGGPRPSPGAGARGAEPEGPAGGAGLARHLLPDAELRDWLRSVGGTPPELLDDDGLWAMFAPTFRGDFSVVDTWRPAPGAAPPPVPLTVFGGDADAVVPPARLAGWAEHTPHFQGLHLHPGDHFYLRDHERAVARQITESLTPLLPTQTAPSQPR